MLFPPGSIRTHVTRKQFTFMVVSRYILAAAMLSAAIFMQSAAADPNSASPTPTNVERWISDLGNDSYSIRQAAAERLMVSGSVAREALDKVANGPDPEIRAAARRLVTLIDESEFSRRLAEFAADVDGQKGVILPGWKEFGQLVGQNEAARALFVAMQREEAPLLQQVFGEPNHTPDIAWDSQLARLMNWRLVSQQGGHSAPLGSCATMFFLGALPEAKMTDAAASNLARLAQLSPIGESLAEKNPHNVVRRLVTNWIVDCPSRNEQVLQQRLDLMLQYQLAEALPLALAMLDRAPKYLVLHPSQRVAAIVAVGKFGSVDHVPALEPLLQDRAVFFSPPPANGPQGFVHPVQVRDVALANLLHLTGQEPVTYGFLHARPHPQVVFDATSLGMENDERREAAADQWRAWRVQHSFDHAEIR